MPSYLYHIGYLIVYPRSGGSKIRRSGRLPPATETACSTQEEIPIFQRALGGKTKAGGNGFVVPRPDVLWLIVFYTMPWAIMALATFMKPATLAPFT